MEGGLYVALPQLLLQSENLSSLVIILNLSRSSLLPTAILGNSMIFSIISTMDWLDDKQERDNGLFKEKWTLAEQLLIRTA